MAFCVFLWSVCIVLVLYLWWCCGQLVVEACGPYGGNVVLVVAFCVFLVVGLHCFVFMFVAVLWAACGRGLWSLGGLCSKSCGWFCGLALAHSGAPCGLLAPSLWCVCGAFWGGLWSTSSDFVVLCGPLFQACGGRGSCASACRP